MHLFRYRKSYIHKTRYAVRTPKSKWLSKLIRVLLLLLLLLVVIIVKMVMTTMMTRA